MKEKTNSSEQQHKPAHMDIEMQNIQMYYSNVASF